MFVNLVEEMKLMEFDLFILLVKGSCCSKHQYNIAIREDLQIM